MKDNIVNMGDIINALQVFTNSKLCDNTGVDKESIEYLNTQLSILEKLQKVIEADNSKLLSEEECNNRLTKLQQDVKEKESALEYLRDINTKLSDKVEKHKDIENENVELKYKISELEKEKSSLEFKLKSVETSNDNTTALNTLIEKINSMQDDSIYVKNTLIDMNKSIVNSNDNYKSSLDILTNYSKSIEGMDSKVERTIKDVKEQKSVFEKVIDNYNKTLESLTSHRDSIEHIEKDVKENIDNINSTKNKVEDNTKCLNELKSKVKENSSILDKIKGIFHD